ncbi:hypothetical protein [Roseicella aquatilis]|uniref:Uncharacterized protein n=1 Tax=Roseicella aquatilis TaxID=2527868 RepID=A0A4R4DMX1_9PROT|nr:hypothetical protein [Roseicella aquatilis]TCZ61080.1 hypothetical protein EXY23_13190 [Roseicella aquatilis]
MPDLPLPPLIGSARPTGPEVQRAAHRLRRALARSCPPESALLDLQAYLVALRPGLPRVLAREQAEAILAAIGGPPPASAA